MNADLRTPATAPKARVGGAILCVLVAMLTKYTLLDPLRDAELQRGGVQTSPIVAAIPMFAVLGLALLVFGDGATQWMKKYEGRPTFQRVVIFALVGVGGALYLWQEHQLAAFGYR